MKLFFWGGGVKDAVSLCGVSVHTGHVWINLLNDQLPSLGVPALSWLPFSFVKQPAPSTSS